MKKISRLLAVLLAVTLMIPGMGLVANAEEASDDPVKRIEGKSRRATAIEVSELCPEIADDKVKTVVIVGNDGDADALTGTMLAAEKNAPILITKKDETEDILEERLEDYKNLDTIYILGGEKVISDSVVKDLQLKGYTVDQSAGKNRAATAVLAAKKVKTKTDHVFLAEGYEKLADALAIGPVSARDKTPVLLTRKGELPKETKKALKDMGVKNVTILGGKKSVSEDVENEIKELEIELNDRVFGASRYETAVKIAEERAADKDTGITALTNAYTDAVDKVGKLADGATKTTLETRLEAVKAELDQRNEDFREGKAIEAVVAAEKALDKDKPSYGLAGTEHGKAVKLVEKLEDGSVKTDLTARLAEVKKSVEANAALLKLTPTSKKEDIDAAQVLVTALKDGKAKTSLQNRLDKLADRMAADEVDKMILKTSNSIADVTVEKDEDLAIAAKAAYDKLTKEQKALVKNFDHLEKVLAKIEQIKSDEAGNLAIAAVNAQIKALPEVADVKLTDETDVKAARTAYNALTTGQKTYVTDANQNKLVALENKIIDLKAVINAKAVEVRIANLPSAATVTLANGTDVIPTNQAYNALTADEQALVPNVAKLDEVVTAYQGL